MGALVRFLFLLVIKTGSRLLWSFDSGWVGAAPARPFGDVRLALLLNHTSLFEPIFMAVFPPRWLWRVAAEAVIPGADITLERPVAGRVFKWMSPKVIAISRARDHTWDAFMEEIDHGAVVLMAPEGRMKRANGLDKKGRPMSMMSGVVDILARLDRGDLLLFYSAGLHHVHEPGRRFPRLFRRVKSRMEQMPIREFKARTRFDEAGGRERVLAELERLRDLHCR